MAQQTAVEWLVTEINEEIEYIPITQWDRIRNVIQQAKQMEKQQIKMAWRYGDGEFDKTAFQLSEKYYNETYGSNNQI